MPKSIRITLATFGGLTVAAGLVALAIFLTLTGAPAFYQAAVERDPALCEQDNDRCLQQAAALASDLQSPGEWEAIFSADQINGWLAIDLARNYGKSLPPQIMNPRIDFHNGAATLACTYRHAGHETVMSIAFDLYLSEPNVVALRLRRVRAGLLPVPLADVLRVIAQAGHGFGLLVQWRQIGGDPVALVHLSHGIDDADSQLQLEAIELREGEIYIAGRTMPPSQAELARREDHALDRATFDDAENSQGASPDSESSAGETGASESPATDRRANDAAIR
ncbi:MAG TPA: hypothetical protein VGG30_07320 [Pirellulales bacterium]